MQQAELSKSVAPQVRLALGWRAREVVQQSTAPVRFNDDDRGAEIFEDGPVALAYADPAHAFVLPAGRYLRVDQAAGRVYEASASPQLDVLGAEATTALAESVVKMLEGAGWQRVSGEGLGPRAAVVEAARAANSDGVGEVEVGTWRVPRSPGLWAVVPPDPKPYTRDRDGVEAVLTIRPMKRRSATAGVPMLLSTLRINDDRLASTLVAMTEARRARRGDETLAGWDRQPAEVLSSSSPR